MEVITNPDIWVLGPFRARMTKVLGQISPDAHVGAQGDNFPNAL